MSTQDRARWDERYGEIGEAPAEVGALPVFAHVSDLFPTSGTALEIACGRGRGAVWLAARGMTVQASDVSPVAIELAQRHADDMGVAERCDFHVWDLDDGLPPGDPVDLVLCHLFREAEIDQAMIDRLAPGGLLAVACLSEVGHGPGNFRAKPGALTDAFASLETVEAGEADGHAWFLGRRQP